MKRFILGVVCAAVLTVGASTIFPPVDAQAATIHPMAADPYDPIA